MLRSNVPVVDPTMRASLIVVAWNGLDDLPTCLASLQREVGPDDELIVVDNHSTDGSADFVAEHFPQVILLPLANNRGYAGGANAGLRWARGTFLFILNQDIELRPGWLDAMLQALGRPGVGVVGCKLLGMDGLLQHAGGIIRWPRAIPDHFGYGEVDAGQWDVVADVDYVTGAAWGFSRAMMSQIGLLDEGFWPGYFEEVDYCYRVAAGGAAIQYEPSAVAIHAESTSFRKNSRYYLESFHRNRLRFVFKHCSPAEFLTGFVPEERVWLQHDLGQDYRLIMARIYKRALTWLPRLYTQAGMDMPLPPVFVEMTHALCDLHAWCETSVRSVEGADGGYVF